MCWETEAGLVQSVGKIRLEKPNDHPEFLQDFQYTIFKEEEDKLGLIYHAVCIDLVLDSRGTNPVETYKRLKNSVVSYINVTLSCFADKSKAYDALKEQKENRDESRELIYRAYNEVIAHNDTIFYSRLRPHYKRLYDSISSSALDFMKEAACEHTHFFSSAYNEEEIERLYKPQKLSDEEIKRIVVFNSLLNNMIRQNQRAMA